EVTDVVEVVVVLDVLVVVWRAPARTSSSPSPLNASTSATPSAMPSTTRTAAMMRQRRPESGSAGAPSSAWTASFGRVTSPPFVMHLPSCNAVAQYRAVPFHDGFRRPYRRGVAWPADAEALDHEQERIAALTPPPWRPA